MTAPFALVLRDLRLRHCKTQTELAHLVGFEQSFLSSLELGTKNPTSDFLDRLVRGLNLCDEDRDELLAEAAASQNRFALGPEIPEETFRFCYALFQKIDRLHPALISAMHAMLKVEDELKTPVGPIPTRLRRQTQRGIPM